MKAFLLLTLVLITGCAGTPFKATPGVALDRTLTTCQLAHHAWPEQNRRYRVKQTVLFEMRGAKVPMTGLMDLDTRQGSIRLIAVNDLGVKFFDLQLNHENETLHYLLPELARFPDFDKVVARAVRRIFLTPRPDGNENLRYRKQRYLMTRHDAETLTRFEFGGNGAQLLAIEQSGPEQDWRIDYFEQRGTSAPAAPGGILLQDRHAGYRLTLWLDEVVPHEP